MSDRNEREIEHVEHFILALSRARLPTDARRRRRLLVAPGGIARGSALPRRRRSLESHWPLQSWPSSRSSVTSRRP